MRAARAASGRPSIAPDALGRRGVAGGAAAAAAPSAAGHNWTVPYMIEEFMSAPLTAPEMEQAQNLGPAARRALQAACTSRVNVTFSGGDLPGIAARVKGVQSGTTLPRLPRHMCSLQPPV